MEDELKSEIESGAEALSAEGTEQSTEGSVASGEPAADSVENTSAANDLAEAELSSDAEPGNVTSGETPAASSVEIAPNSPSPEKDPLDDLPPVDDVEDEVDPSTLEKSWYILKVQVNRETSICDTLKRRVQQYGLGDYFGEMLVPTEDVREYTKSGKQRIVKRKLYPGYIMVNMAITEDSWWLVRDTPGIGDFTGMGGKPAPLGEEEITRIMKAARPETVEDPDAKEEIKTAIKQKIGERVRVKDGNFENFEGEVSAIDERNGRITVLINIFGRLNPVELDHWQVESL